MRRGEPASRASICARGVARGGQSSVGRGQGQGGGALQRPWEPSPAELAAFLQVRRGPFAEAAVDGAVHGVPHAACCALVQSEAVLARDAASRALHASDAAGADCSARGGLATSHAGPTPSRRTASDSAAGVGAELAGGVRTGEGCGAHGGPTWRHGGMAGAPAAAAGWAACTIAARLRQLRRCPQTLLYSRRSLALRVAVVSGRLGARAAEPLATDCCQCSHATKRPAILASRCTLAYHCMLQHEHGRRAHAAATACEVSAYHPACKPLTMRSPRGRTTAAMALISVPSVNWSPTQASTCATAMQCVGRLPR